MTLDDQSSNKDGDVRAYHVPNISERQLLACKLERRVDVVVFRSHFAKSIFNARAVVKGGFVKVNSVQCVHPAYRLKDGDMITVHPFVIPTLVHQISADDSPDTPTLAEQLLAKQVENMAEDVTESNSENTNEEANATHTAETKSEDNSSNSDSDNTNATSKSKKPKYQIIPKTRDSNIAYTFNV